MSFSVSGVMAWPDRDIRRRGDAYRALQMHGLRVDPRDDLPIPAPAEGQDHDDRDGEARQQRRHGRRTHEPQPDAGNERDSRRPNGELQVAVHLQSGRLSAATSRAWASPAALR